MPETEREQPNEQLIDIFETEQESEAMVVRGLLESAGIQVLQTSFDAPQDVLPGVGGVALRVREEQAEEARAIIAEYQNKGLTEAEADAGTGTGV
jgi:putative signal transducing protein